MTAAVVYVLRDSDFGSPPPSTLVQRQDYQMRWQQPGPPQLQGTAQLEAGQIYWQQPDPLQSDEIDWAERINEQMMRQRYRDHLKRLEDLR
jgi:hypothetical protein